MDPTAHLDAKLDRLLEGQVRLEVKVETFERRVAKIEKAFSGEKSRLDKRFETDVRPLRARYDGVSFLLKTLGVLALVGGVAGSALKISDYLAPKPAPQSSPDGVKDHAPMPEVRIRHKSNP